MKFEEKRWEYSKENLPNDEEQKIVYKYRLSYENMSESFNTKTDASVFNNLEAMY